MLHDQQRQPHEGTTYIISPEAWDKEGNPIVPFLVAFREACHSARNLDISHTPQFSTISEKPSFWELSAWMDQNKSGRKGRKSLDVSHTWISNSIWHVHISSVSNFICYI